MSEPAADRIVDRPQAGRVFTAPRRVRFGDVGRRSGARLAALVAYVQDVAGDDVADAALGEDLVWVVRRTVVEVHRPASFFEDLELTTWCSGIGGRWAERRVAMAGHRGARIEAAVLWVRIDEASGRALRLTDDFVATWGEAAGGREVSARLRHPGPPADPGPAEVRPWPLRAGDFDLLGHVNNAAAWAMVDDELDRRGGPVAPFRAELEYRVPVEPGAAVDLVVRAAGDGDGFDLWAVGRPAGADPTEPPVVFTSGRVRALPDARS